MEFLTGKTASAKQQYLAIGDGVGSLHVFDVPRSLWKPIPNEKKTVKNFFDREIKRLTFVDQRNIAREEEYVSKVKAKESDGEPSELHSDTPTAEVDEDEKAMLLEEENAYKRLEAKFVEQLQLKRVDLPHLSDIDFSKLNISS